jgi:hypothetical protein
VAEPVAHAVAFVTEAAVSWRAMAGSHLGWWRSRRSRFAGGGPSAEGTVGRKGSDGRLAGAEETVRRIVPRETSRSPA